MDKEQLDSLKKKSEKLEQQLQQQRPRQWEN